MKPRIFAVTALVLACMLLALPAPALATPPEPLTIEVTMWMTGEDSAAGICTMSGLFAASGPCTEVFFMADGTTHGIKTVAITERDTFTVRYQAQITWTSETTAMALGRWVIVSGTGAYKKLHGVGTTEAYLDLTTFPAPLITATYEGTGHFD